METIVRNIFLLVVILAVGGAGAYWYFIKNEHPAVEAYSVYRKAAATAEAKNTFPNDRPRPMLADWKLKIDSKTISGDTTMIVATETTAWTHENAASLAFATIITKIYRAELQKQNGAWQVVKEDMLKKNISAFDERRKQ
jgi:hypothetical protein